VTVEENHLSYTVREFDFSIACLFGTAQSGSILRMYPKDEGIPRAAQPDLVKSRRLVQLRISRWQLSITRYQGLLKPKLDETERQEIRTLLQEEKLSLKRHALKANQQSEPREGNWVPAPCRAGVEGEELIIERTVRQDAIRGTILGALAFLGVVRS
jgi:hypothetical protein